MHFKPVFLGVLLATSALSFTAANAAVDPAHEGNPMSPVVTNHGRVESANHAANTHAAKKLEAERQEAKSRAENRQKAVQKKNNQIHEKVQAKNSAAEHHVNKINTEKEKQQALFPPKK
ncbi:hypothetical protein [Lonsdalea britannica]|uniref:hypothetical protein n=1 Tax=Lonsdalea britannica TaxID=1082704 RepID=UPI0026EAC883|nr:hypothetical protein [Lonsdalea britannica]